VTGKFNDIITGRYAVSPTGIDNQNLMGGSSGSDVLEGGSGNDILWGGDNNNNNGIERMDGNSASGFDDLDYASYAGASGAVTVNLFTGNSGAGFITGTNQSGDFGSASGANAGNDTLINIEGVIGSSAGDTFNGGNYFFETYRGGGGNDAINGNGGLDNAEYTDATLGVTMGKGFVMTMEAAERGVGLAQLVFWTPALQLLFGNLRLPGPGFIAPVFAVYLLRQLFQVAGRPALAPAE